MSHLSIHTALGQDTKMAAPVKKRAVNLEDKKPSKDDRKDSETSEESCGEGENFENVGNEVIQVDFEGRNPIDSDFHGIKQLLSQLFLKAHLNLTELTNLIIGQNYVGSVIKQSEGEEEDSDDDDNDVNEVFGITTVINLTEKQKLECVQQLRTLLLELCVEHGSDEVVTFVRSLLSDDNKPLGLLINERIVNIPAQIVVPMLKSLRSEINRAVQKKMAFDFSYFILICKLYKTDLTNNKKKSKKNKQSEEIIWSNLEEEIIDQNVTKCIDCRVKNTSGCKNPCGWEMTSVSNSCCKTEIYRTYSGQGVQVQEAEVKFEFSVERETDSGLGGNWTESDDEMTPLRRVLIIPAGKLDQIIEKIEQEVAP